MLSFLGKVPLAKLEGEKYAHFFHPLLCEGFDKKHLFSVKYLYRRTTFAMINV